MENNDCTSGFELLDFNDKFKKLYFNEEYLSIVEVVGTEYLVHGKRKPEATLKEAAIQAVDKKLKQLKKDATKAEELMAAITTGAN